MARSRPVGVAMCAAGAVGLLAIAPDVAAADAVSGELIRGLNQRLLYMAVPIAVLVEVILVYAVLRFRDNEAPEPTRENRQLEITWTVATGLVLLFVGTASFTVLASPYVGDIPASATANGQGGGQGHSHGPDGVSPGVAPADAVEVVGVAEQWRWTFEYPDANRTSDELVLPRDRELYIYVTSEDVLHSLHVPELGLKQDAFPGQYNLLRTRATSTGTHRLYCAEFCGANHATMDGTVRVVDPEEFDRWLDGNATGNGNGTDGGSGSGTDDATAIDRDPARETP